MTGRPANDLAADARRRFDRVEILHRLRAVEEGGTTSFERELVSRLETAEAQVAALTAELEALRNG